MIWETPIKIAGKSVKNRIVFPPLSANWAAPDGSVTERIVRFYREIAEGGAGMIVVSGAAVSLEGKGSGRSLCLYDKIHLPGFKELAEVIKGEGAFASAQIMHSGGQGNPEFTGCVPVSPSGGVCRATGCLSRPLHYEEIGEIRRRFIKSAAMAAEAGFDALELHLAHGYLLHEFMSRHTNRREDDYGGSTFNRLRLALEIIEGIKLEAPGLIIGVRISGEDYLPDGICCDVNRLYLPILEEAGAEYFSVTAGVYETSGLKHEAMAEGEFFDYSRGVKSMVSQPVIGVGKILDLEMAEERLARKDCDMVAIGRGMVADPQMIAKTRRGEPVNRCTECGECQYLRFGRSEMSCPLWEVQYV